AAKPVERPAVEVQQAKKPKSRRQARPNDAAPPSGTDSPSGSDPPADAPSPRWSVQKKTRPSQAGASADNLTAGQGAGRGHGGGGESDPDELNRRLAWF